MLHAYRYPIPGLRTGRPHLLIGLDESATLLEIGVAAADGIDFIVHAMPTRPQFLE